MRKTAYVALLLLLILAFAVSGFSQAQPQFKSRPGYDAYNAAYNEKDPANKAALSAKFLADFKDKEDPYYLNLAYMMLVKGYLDAKNFPKAMETAAAVDTGAPGLATDKKATIYSYGMQAAQNANDMGKIVEFGDKVLAIVPTDANTLITLASLIPERLPADDAGKKVALDKAEGYATKAKQVIDAMAKPAGMADGDWNTQKANVLATIQSDLGLIALTRVDYEKAVAAYEDVIKATPKDGLAQFRLGLAYSGQAAAITKLYLASVNDYNEAIKGTDKAQQDDLKAKSDALEQKLRAKRTQATDALATAVALGGPVAQPAGDQLKKLWTGTPEEMNALIASKKPQ